MKKDARWKGIIEDCFEDFLQFFYPDHFHEIDLDTGFEFLDKELLKLFPESTETKRYADKLVKVFLKNGEEHWILIHVEVQGYQDDSFTERMFIYFYRIYDRFRKPISAVAVFTDSRPSFHPKEFAKEFWGTSIQYRFNTYKLRDTVVENFQAQSNNPFAIVLEVAWLSLQKRPDRSLMLLKTHIAKKLFQQGFERTKIEAILNFIRYYVRFENNENNRKFEEQLEILTNHKPMGIREHILEEAKKEGLEEGLERGLERGLEEGEHRGLKMSISKLLAKGFSSEEVVELLEISPVLVEEVLVEMGDKASDD